MDPRLSREHSDEMQRAETAEESQTPSKKNRGWIKYLGFGISALCLFLAFRKVEWQELESTFKQMNLWALLLGLLLANFHNFIQAARWHVLLRPLGKLSFWNSWWSLRLSFFFNASLPARLGDPFKIYYLKRFTTINVGRSVGAYAADRFLELVSLLALVYVSALVLGLRGSLPSTSLVVGIAAASALLLILFSKLPPKAEGKALNAILQFRVRLFEGIKPLSDPKVLLLSLPLSFFGWFVEALTISVLAYGVGYPLSIYKAFIVNAGINLAISVPSSPGNIGTFQLGALAVLSYFGVQQEPALAIAILYHMVQFIPTLIIGALGYQFHYLRLKPLG